MLSYYCPTLICILTRQTMANPRQPSIKHLTSLAFTKPPVIEISYKQIYGEKPLVTKYATDTKLFEEQFYFLLDALCSWGKKNLSFDDQKQKDKKQETDKTIETSIETLKKNIFDKRYSHEFLPKDFEELKSKLEEILYLLNNADFTLEKKRDEYLELVKEFHV